MLDTKVEETLNEEEKQTVGAIVAKFVGLGVSATFRPPVSVGPIVSVYRFQPTGTTRVSQIENMAADFAVALAAEDVVVRREKGDTSVSIYVPNKKRKLVTYLETIGNVWNTKLHIPLNFGVDYMGRPAVEDLVTLPHLLVAGSTGSGKSTLVSSLIASLIYTKTPKQIQLVLSDTKTVEFPHFRGAPHLMFEPAPSVEKTLSYLDWVIDQMEERLLAFGKAGCRNIFEYGIERLPFIIVVIDELADILQCDTKEDEDNNKGKTLGKIASGKLSYIAQKARAAGVHVIASTQRPGVKLVEGQIKANFPARLTFRLPTEADSRTVLGCGGAEHLLAQGDMLYSSPNKPGLQRLHAPYAKIEDIRAAVDAAVRRHE